MEFAIVGWPGEGATLRLDYRAFAYAGKFVVGGPGKAVLRTADGSAAVPDWEPDEPLPDRAGAPAFDDDTLAAVSFSPDRTEPSCCRIRYVTVHVARRGEGLGPGLIARTVPRLAGRGYGTARIAVNNPFAYEALYKAGFAYVGERTGIAELVLERPIGPTAGRSDDRDADADLRNVDVDPSDAGNDDPGHVDRYDDSEHVDRYRAGLDRFRERDLTGSERRFLADRVDGEPPDPIRPE